MISLEVLVKLFPGVEYLDAKGLCRASPMLSVFTHVLQPVFAMTVQDLWLVTRSEETDEGVQISEKMLSISKWDVSSPDRQFPCKGD